MLSTLLLAESPTAALTCVSLSVFAAIGLGCVLTRLALDVILRGLQNRRGAPSLSTSR